MTLVKETAYTTRLDIKTTIEIAVLKPEVGAMVYDTTTETVKVSDGASFSEVGGLLTHTQTLSSVELLALGSTPVDLIAAPGAGLAIWVLHANMTLNYNSIAYDFGGGPGSGLGLKTPSAGLAQATYASSIINLSSSITAGGVLGGFTSTPAYIENEKLTATTTSGPSTGDSPIDLTVIYVLMAV